MKSNTMSGFKDFLLRGNLIELAVAFIMGGAFAEVVKAFTAMIMDLLGKLGGTPNFSGWAPEGIHVGTFLTVLISFVILSAVVYFGLVMPYEKFRNRKKVAGDESAPTTEELLVDIRDMLAQQRAR